MNQINPEVLDAIAKTDPVAGDKLDKLRAKATELRDLDLLEAQLEEEMETVKSRRNAIVTTEMLELMDAAGIPTFDLEASGNAPRLTLEVRPYYNAGISAKWPDERKRAAYDYLDAEGSGDLIKTTITVAFPREKRTEAQDVISSLRNKGLDVEVKESVSSQTLTAWLRETVEEHRPMPDLEKIGGHVGRIVKVKEARNK